MANREAEFLAKGVEIIWVLEQSPTFSGGTMDNCLDVMGTLGATAGWCVGDDEIQPQPNVFDDSPFSVNRGFDMLVPRSTMTIEWTSSHGSPAGNDNPSASEMLDAVDALRAELGLPALP